MSEPTTKPVYTSVSVYGFPIDVMDELRAMCLARGREQNPSDSFILGEAAIAWHDHCKKEGPPK